MSSDVPVIPLDFLRELAGFDPHHTRSTEPAGSYGGEWHLEDGKVVWDPKPTQVYVGDLAAYALALREVVEEFAKEGGDHQDSCSWCNWVKDQVEGDGECYDHIEPDGFGDVCKVARARALLGDEDE